MTAASQAPLELASAAKMQMAPVLRAGATLSLEEAIEPRPDRRDRYYWSTVHPQEGLDE
jgi:hypothetical protein